MFERIVKNDCSFGAVRFGDHGFSRLHPGDQRGPACWEFFDLFCVHRGSLELSVEQAGRFTLRRGEGMLILPRTRFRQHAGRRGARISVQHFRFDEDIDAPLPEPLERLRGRSEGVEPIRFGDQPGLASEVERAIHFAYLPESSGLHDLRVAQLILILGRLEWSGPAVSGALADPRVLELQRRIEAERHIQRVTPGDMAEWVGLSPSRFRVWFKQQYGLSPKQFLMRRRVNRAMRLLRETDRPIKAIARELGYPDLSTFYHAFRHQTRTTPAAYRRRHTVVG